eukprot:6487822-Amphidinium_carterae.1
MICRGQIPCQKPTARMVNIGHGRGQMGLSCQWREIGTGSAAQTLTILHEHETDIDYRDNIRRSLNIFEPEIATQSSG